MQPDRLSADFLTGCLRSCGALEKARVSAFSARSVGEGRGFAGTVVRLGLQYDIAEAGAPASVIAKFSSERAAMREILERFGGDLREVRFYREIAPRLPLSTPRCYLAHHDDENGRVFLLLEDLAPAQSADLEVGLSVEQAKLVLEQLARLHACFWDRIGELDWLAPTEAMFDAMRERYLAAVARLDATTEQYPTFLRVARLLAELLKGRELVAMLRRGPLALVHGDVHPDNVLLPSLDGGRLALIDWQSVSVARHGTVDVARLLTLGLRPELRRAHEDELLGHYHAALAGGDVRGFSLPELRQRYREEVATMVLLAVLTSEMVDLQGERAQRLSVLYGERIELALRDARLV